MPTALAARALDKGFRETFGLGRDIVRARIVAGRSSPREPTFVFLSPVMNSSGAPEILMQILEDFAERYGSGSLRLLSPSVAPELRSRAEARGVRVERAVSAMGPTLLRVQLSLRQSDFVLMNSLAVLPNYQAFVFNALQSARLAHAFWYIHEDRDQLAAVAPFLLEPASRARIGRLVSEGQLTLLVPSRRAKRQYDHLFTTSGTNVLPYKVDVDEEYMVARPVSEYMSQRFLLIGRPTDGRKGHMTALAAFHEFMKTYYERDPETYRNFTLTFVGLGDDYISEQLRSIGTAVLGQRFRVVPAVSHAESLKIARACNTVISCSFNEALPLNVLEGMRMGHVVLRNDAGGMDEQLDEAVNGYRIDSGDIKQFAAVLDRVLNRRTTSDSRLQAMGRASQEMVAGLRVSSYAQALEAARGAEA